MNIEKNESTKLFSNFLEEGSAENFNIIPNK